MLDLDKFKQRIKERCAQTGVSQSFLCEKVGRQRTYLNNIWRGTTTPTEEDLRQFADSLNTTPEYLRGETDDPAPQKFDVMAIINASPRKRELAEKILSMDGAALLKLEKILDMILEEE